MWSFQQAGISLPHSSQALAHGGQPVSMDQMQPGDVVTYYSDASHVGHLHRRRNDGARVHLRHAGASRPGEQCADLQRPPVLTVDASGLLRHRADLRAASGRQAASGTGGPGRGRARLAHHAHRSVDHRDVAFVRRRARFTSSSLGGAHTRPLLARIAAEMNDAAQAVTAFWGADWPRDIVIVATGSDAQFGSLAGGGPDIAATTTAERIMFAPGAAAMSDASLRIVLRHELFHYASRARYRHRRTALAHRRRRRFRRPARRHRGRVPARRTVGANSHRRRPRAPPAPPGRWPTTAPGGSAASSPTRYGSDTLRRLYLRACGPGHPDVATAVRETLGADLPTVLARLAALAVRLA